MINFRSEKCLLDLSDKQIFFVVKEKMVINKLTWRLWIGRKNFAVNKDRRFVYDLIFLSLSTRHSGRL